MNHREDLEIKLQKVTLAIHEIVEDIYKTDQGKQRIIDKLIDFKEEQLFPKVLNLILISG